MSQPDKLHEAWKKKKKKLTVIETPPSPRWLLITTFHPRFAV